MKDYEAAGFEGIGSGAYTTGHNGKRWPGIVWPPAEPENREHGWTHLQNVARAEAHRRRIHSPIDRVKIYGYMGPDGWAYTIGDLMCQTFAYRPGVRDVDAAPEDDDRDTADVYEREPFASPWE